MAVVTPESQPTDAHAHTFELICSRWREIWPEFRRIITELMQSHGSETPGWNTVRSVYIHVPEVAIAEDGEWSIGVVFSRDETLWSLPYCGWFACPQQAQAIY